MYLIVFMLAVSFKYPTTRDSYALTFNSINSFLEKHILFPKANFHSQCANDMNYNTWLLKIVFTKPIISDCKYVPLVTRVERNTWPVQHLSVSKQNYDILDFFFWAFWGVFTEEQKLTYFLTLTFGC